MTDITPGVPAGRQVIQAYGNGGFRVAGQRYEGSLLILPHIVRPLAAGHAAALLEMPPEKLFEMLMAAFEGWPEAAEPGLDILLLGCGPAIQRVPSDFSAYFRARRVAIDAMNTGAACRTFNVLVLEDRRVGACLLAVD